MLYIDFGEKEKNICVNGTLENAKRIAENNITFTQKPIKIYNKKNQISLLQWIEGLPYKNEDVLIYFKDFGFYQGWIDVL